MVPWQPLLECRRAHSRRMETLTSSPPRVKNGGFSKNHPPQVSCFSPGVMEAGTFLLNLAGTGNISAKGNLHPPFSENHYARTIKGCHTFLLREAILLAPLFPHSPFSENPFSDLGEGVTTPNVWCYFFWASVHRRLWEIQKVSLYYESKLIVMCTAFCKGQI
jgi:hypothetical protein